jgi:hypothetical protein
MEELKKALRKAIEAEFISVQDWEEWNCGNAWAELEVEYNHLTYVIRYTKTTCTSVMGYQEIGDRFFPEYNSDATTIRNMFIPLVNECVAELYELEAAEQNEVFMVDDMRDTYDELEKQFV